MPDELRQQLAVDVLDHADQIKLPATASGPPQARVPACAALAHTEELLDRRAVEVSGCHGTQGAEDFVKSMKPGGFGRAWGDLLLYYMLGSDPALWPAGERGGGGMAYQRRIEGVASA